MKLWEVDTEGVAYRRYQVQAESLADAMAAVNKVLEGEIDPPPGWFYDSDLSVEGEHVIGGVLLD